MLSLNGENAAREDDYEDIDDNVFCELNDRIPDNFDWSQNYSEQHSKGLQEFATIFYQQQRQRFVTEKPDEPLELFEENIHTPENAKTDAQKFLVFHHLHHQYQLELFKNNLIQEHLPSQFVLRKACLESERHLSLRHQEALSAESTTATMQMQHLLQLVAWHH